MNRINLRQVETSERFYRVPKALLLHPAYKDLRADSKLVYAILKDRLELSIQNNRVDYKGDVYLNYSIKSLEELLGFGKNKIIAIKKELQEYGLIEEERPGLNRANRIYVGDVDPENVVIHRANPLQDKEVLKSNFQKFENQTSRSLEIKPQEVSKSNSNDTKLSDTKLSDTKLSDTNSTNDDDDDDLYTTPHDTKTKNSNTEALLKIGNILNRNIELRPVVHNLIPDLLVNEPRQSLEVVSALVDAKSLILKELKNGNTILNQRQIIRGDDSIVSLLEDTAAKQLAYMNEHLANSNSFGQYFANGLNQRLQVAITTDKFATGY
ncbi:replication initiator protein A [Leuconostoc citreum]|uniref:replication initiator protein A n=1 Tax=Leuconostoc citreum TaxID=33964 RepID=UPI00200A5961|nr:replication initiator protein A [Leuconostoc citreum]MCK8605771.1 replication initiator protein A [Leuconostoc citreum]